MGMGFAPTWLGQVSPPASQNHSNHWIKLLLGISHRLPSYARPAVTFQQEGIAVWPVQNYTVW